VGIARAGKAYLYNAGPTNWDLIKTFQNPTPDEGDVFGFSVAGIEDNILIGAPYDNPGQGNVGTVYLFKGAESAAINPDIRID